MKQIRMGQTNLAILNGDADLSVWSEEELIRGQQRDVNGRWSGRPPKVVPKAIHDELVRRKMSKAYELMRDNVVEATTVLVDIAKDADVDPAVRLKAVAMIQDRVLGKAPDRVELLAMLEPPPWLRAIEAGIVTVSKERAIDVEVVAEGA